jgi:hypothetical protein
MTHIDGTRQSFPYFNMATLQEIPLAPPPTKAPDCILCGKPTRRRIARVLNPNGNAGRPYYKCIPCDKFHCFCDSRGNDPTNPPCHCGKSSKRQVSGHGKAVPRGVHFVCRLGTCDFYRALRDAEERQIQITPCGSLVDQSEKLVVERSEIYEHLSASNHELSSAICQIMSPCVAQPKAS